MTRISYKTVLQGSVVILIFAWIALGPYSSIYQQAIDQVKGPVEIAYRAAKNAVYDIYLLATNPTEWYARQQVINARPEKPISFPKALEVVSLDATPPSVPGGQPFVLNFVLRNDGDLAVSNVRVTASCNQWCDPPPPEAVRAKFSLCVDYTLRNEVWCAESCEDYYNNDRTKRTAENCVDTCKKQEVSVGPAGITNLCNTRDAKQLEQGVYFSKDKYQRSEGEIVTVEPFVANSFAGREAETRIAKVYLNVSFEHSTTSQLLVTVMGEDERTRLIKERRLEFKPVIATAKVSPAKLSINVGPQPLQASTQEQKREATLLVSVSNDRDDSRIILDRGNKIIITLPREVGHNLRCEGSTSWKRSFLLADGTESNADSSSVMAEKLVYGIQPSPDKERIEILPFEFNTVFVFLCKFDTADDASVGTQKTGIVTANLTSYRFVHTIEKDVPVTTPVGILFDPYEGYCNQCGAGTFEECDVGECHALSARDTRKIGTCYYEYAGTGRLPGLPDIPTPQTLLGNACHSCGKEPKCEKFHSQPTCEAEARRCGLFNCKWNPDAKHSISGVDLNGACETTKVVARVPLPPEAVGKVFTVRASREGLVGGTTASGHVIVANDRFAALPDPSALNQEIQVTYKSKTVRTKVLDVGPWYIDDGYWSGDGVPQAQKDWQAKEPIGRGRQEGVESCLAPGASGKCNNGAGLDLADGIYSEMLGSDPDKGILEGVQWSFVLPPVPAGVLTPGQFQDALKQQTGQAATITSTYYSPRPAPRNRHLGYDFELAAGTQVRTVYPGRVVNVLPWDNEGSAVWVESTLGGKQFVTSYGHVEPAVRVGDSIAAGTPVGTIANDHLDVKLFLWPLAAGEQWYNQAFDWTVT